MHDNKLELKLISQLMDQLQGEMEYDEDDLASRLGRKKPGIEMVKIEGKMPMHGMDDPMEKMEEMTGRDLDNDMEMGEDPEHAAMVMDEGEDDEDMSPEDMLKKRLMKLRA